MRHHPDDPILHTHGSDVLPADHPWADSSVYCAKCNVMLHAENNECMQSWVEYERVALCTECGKSVFQSVSDFMCFYGSDRKLLSMAGKVD